MQAPGLTLALTLVSDVLPPNACIINRESLLGPHLDAEALAEALRELDVQWSRPDDRTIVAEDWIRWHLAHHRDRQFGDHRLIEARLAVVKASPTDLGGHSWHLNDQNPDDRLHLTVNFRVSREVNIITRHIFLDDPLAGDLIELLESEGLMRQARRAKRFRDRDVAEARGRRINMPKQWNKEGKQRMVDGGQWLREDEEKAEHSGSCGEGTRGSPPERLDARVKKEEEKHWTGQLEGSLREDADDDEKPEAGEDSPLDADDEGDAAGDSSETFDPVEDEEKDRSWCRKEPDSNTSLDCQCEDLEGSHGDGPAQEARKGSEEVGKALIAARKRDRGNREREKDGLARFECTGMTGRKEKKEPG